MKELTMNQLIEKCISEARARHGKISLCSKCNSFVESITEFGGKLLFWYNDSIGSTHTIVIEKATGNFISVK
jgi:hypothetical protein